MAGRCATGSARSLTGGALRAFAYVVVLASTSQSTLDARVSFHPTVFASGYSTDNVTLSTANQPKTEDTSASLGVTLPLRRESRHGWLEFLYGTSYTTYRETTAFDHLDHLLGFQLLSEPNPMSSLKVDACYVRTQEQDIGVGSCTDLFTSERTQRDLFGAVVEYDRLFARRWSWSFRLEGAAANFQPIEGFDPGVTGLLVEDKLGYLATVGLRRQVAKRFSLGASYSYGFVDPEITPDSHTHIFRLDILHDVTRRFKYRLDLGAYHRTFDEVDAASQGELQDQGVEFYFELQYGESKGYQLGPVRLDLNAGIRPTAGGSIQGTSTDAFGRATLSPVRSTKWQWAIDGQYAVRLPTQAQEADLQTFTGEARIEWSVAGWMGVRLRGYYRDQASNDPELAASYYRAEFGMTWYPLGRRSPPRPVAPPEPG